MNLEQLEHELVLLEGKPVIVVKPDYGHVSLSYCGMLSVTRNDAMHVGFHVVTAGPALIFMAEDVISLEWPQGDAEHKVERIIRLKGPHQYAEPWAKA